MQESCCDNNVRGVSCLRVGHLWHVTRRSRCCIKCNLYCYVGTVGGRVDQSVVSCAPLSFGSFAKFVAPCLGALGMKSSATSAVQYGQLACIDARPFDSNSVEVYVSRSAQLGVDSFRGENVTYLILRAVCVRHFSGGCKFRSYRFVKSRIRFIDTTLRVCVVSASSHLLWLLSLSLFLPWLGRGR